MKEKERAGNKDTAKGGNGPSLINKDNSHMDRAKTLLRSSIVDASMKYKKRTALDKSRRGRSASIHNLVISGLFLCLFLGITSALIFFCLY